jgi:hypothetical protein
MRLVPRSQGFAHRFVRYAALATLFATFGAHQARAQDIKAPAPLPSYAVSSNTMTPVAPNVAQPLLDSFSMPEHQATYLVQSVARPKALIPLYVSFASLQALDIISTRHALEHGAHEANPVLAGLASSTPALVAVKAGSTAAIIYVTERLRKRHPVAAVFLMVGLNAGYASIVAHNYSVIGRAGGRE